MQFILKFFVIIFAIAGIAGTWYFYSKQPLRSGEVSLANLQAPVNVRYDERGVDPLPHKNRCFQML